MAEESFKIECPFCTQHIRAYPEHIGFEINCPTCGEMYTIPDPTGSGADDYDYNAVISSNSELTEEDYHALRKESQETTDYIAGLDPSLWWECTAMGELLSNRLQPLRDSVNIQRNPNFHPGTRDEHMAYHHHLDQRSKEFFDIMNFLCRALTKDLQRAVVRPGMKTIVDAANKLEQEITRVRDFHEMLFEHSLPQEEPFPQIQSVLMGWSPFICIQLNQCIEQLYAKGNGPTGDWNEARLVVSIIPPDLPHFLYLKNQLDNKLNK